MPDLLASPSPGALRACMSRFATGVSVGTYAGPDGPRGVTMNSFTSVSADPPLVLISVARTARSHDLLIGRPFCVNILGAEQEALALHFGGRRLPAAADAPWAADARVPRLIGPRAWLECDPWQSHPAGDHTLVLGKVTDLAHRDGDALSYTWSRFGQIAQGALGIEHLI